MNPTLLLLAAAAFALLLFSAAHSSAGEEGGAPEMPGPGKEHDLLKQWVGTWDAEVAIMGQTSRGVEVCQMECGGFWLTTDHQGTVMGGPFQGKGFSGFDPAKQNYVFAWIDSTGAPMSVASGTFSADGKTFTAVADGCDMAGQPARFEHVTTFHDARTRSFEICQILDGGRRESQMKIRYARRAP